MSIRSNTSSLLSAGNMASATLTSSVLSLGEYKEYAIQAVYTGAPVGTLKLQASIDGTNYDDIPGSSISITAAGHTLYNVDGAYYPFAQAVYTKTSGTGSLTITANAKAES